MATPSPATKKRQHAEFEKYMNEISTGSDEYNATGKTPDQLNEMIPKYKRDATANRIEATLRLALEGI